MRRLRASLVGKCAGGSAMKHLSILLAMTLALCVGCASTGNADSRATSLLLGVFDSQRQCYDAWATILDEWIKQTGGLRPGLEASRRMIAEDNRTELSRLIRATWKRLGSPDHVSARDISVAFTEILGDQVPYDCRTIIWLRPLLTETPETFAAGAKQALLNEAPVADRIDNYTFSGWLIIGLLAPQNQLGNVR